MTSFAILRAGAAALALLTVAPGVRAQAILPPPTPNADALATQMRLLAANPRDIAALIAAGELSTRLGDPAAALNFFGRAQAIDPSNPRIVAGRAGTLVLLERPGEALRLFAQAEAAGLPMTPYLAQRGLAYDLIGQSGYAQRDYRRALQAGQDDETVRRLALSLGISGKRDEAMALLDPLLRSSDRGAWRARAFIMAIGGDVAGADRIAIGTMPGGAALSPFFRRLQWLSPADRAFAVHFGQLTATPARALDARLAPALAVLPAETPPLASVAEVAAKLSPTRETGRDRRRDRTRPERERAQPAVVAAVTPTPAPSREPVLLASVTPRLVEPAPSPIVQAAQPAPAATGGGWAVTADSVAPSTPPATPPAVPIAAPIQTVAADVAPAVAEASTPAPTPAPPVQTPAPAPALAQAETSPPPAPAARTPVTMEIIDAPRPVRRRPAVQQPAASPSAQPAPPPEPARRRTANEALLASIVGGISVPASELEVRPAAKPAERKPEPKKAAAPPAETAAKKPEPRKPDPAKGEPARWWVQVAGGARAADLYKDWNRLAAKSPAAFRGKGAWTTPLRATNRLLAGPFKDQAAAMAFVNLLAKDGASAFAWQSEAGQKIDKIALK